MVFPLFRYNSEQEGSSEPPLSILVIPRDVGREGAWRPDALVSLTKTLRTSGFVMVLPPEDLKSLLVMLTFLSPNGHCTVMVQQLATAFHLSLGKTRVRMNRLVDFRWLGQPIIRYHKEKSGVETYALMPGFLPVVEERVQRPATPRFKAMPREVVVEHSRRKYNRPRAEVEAEIARLNNWKLPEEENSLVETQSPPKEMLDPQQAATRQKLLSAGLLPEHADDLLARFDQVRIERQLMWLPHRNVRKPAGFLLAAIKDNYAAPLNWRPTIPQEKMDNEMFDTGPVIEDDAP